MDLRDEVVWSAEAYSLAELKHSRFQYPLLVKADYGLYRSLDDESISVDQLLLLHKWEESERVLAKNKKGLDITIPIDHKHKLEVYETNRTPSKVGLFSLQNIVRCFKPPVLARFDPNKIAEFYLHDKLYSSQEFGVFDLNAVHNLNYVKASAIDDEGNINKEYVSIIPMHLNIEFFVGKGMRHFSKDHYQEMLLYMSLRTERLVSEATHIYTLSGIMEYEDVMEKDYIDIPGYPTWGRNKDRTLKLPLPQIPTDPPRFTNRTVCIVKPEFRLKLPWETATRKQTLPTTKQPIPHQKSDSNSRTSSSYETMTDPNLTNKERQSYLLPSSSAYYNLPDSAHGSLVPIGRGDQSQSEYYNVPITTGQREQTADGIYYNTGQDLDLPNVLQESKYYNAVPDRSAQSHTEYYNTAQTPENTQFKDYPFSDQHGAGLLDSMATFDYRNLWHGQQMITPIIPDTNSSDSSSDYDDTALCKDDIGPMPDPLNSGPNAETQNVLHTLLPPRRSSKSTLPPKGINRPFQVAEDLNASLLNSEHIQRAPTGSASGTSRETQNVIPPSLPPRMTLKSTPTSKAVDPAASLLPEPISQDTLLQSQKCQMAMGSSSNKVSGEFNPVHGFNSTNTYKTQILHSPAEIPEDISNMGIMEIGDCLHHLRLGRCRDKFREFMMDGKLLQQFNEEELMEQFGEFGMGSEAATTVVLFAKGAMRP